MRAALVALPLTVLRVVGADRFAGSFACPDLGAALVAAFGIAALAAGLAGIFFAAVAATGFDCDLDVAGFDTGALVAAGFVAAAFVADVFGEVDLPIAAFGGVAFGADTLVDGLDVSVLIVGFLVVAVAGFSTVFAGLVLALVGDSAASAFLPVAFGVVLTSTVLAGGVLDFDLVVDFFGVVVFVVVRMASACTRMAVSVVTRILLRSGDMVEDGLRPADKRHHAEHESGPYCDDCPPSICAGAYRDNDR
ncbi:hypothetical protein [Acidiphilium acidophilum]|uniref:Uncharacterized protein n=1 Tax=Acidiphilium acidophilum TaxID=76588 RepID=A0AAW9DQQ9_ACIAO|nr:hypothetical protein [Acidiphilium acidophilum]MDX5931330.1 hypothetical protein [Acidiphilium acidophilum]